jgi:hypothetical protein
MVLTISGTRRRPTTSSAAGAAGLRRRSRWIAASAATRFGQAGDQVVPGLVQDARLAFLDRRAHRGEGAGQRADLVAAGDGLRDAVVAGGDAPGRSGQFLHRLRNAARDPGRAEHAGQQAETEQARPRGGDRAIGLQASSTE